jgi:hypothetical protein
MNADYRKLNDGSQSSSTYHKKDGTSVRAILYSQNTGFYLGKRCPKCKSALIGDRAENQWCSNVKCDYGVE